jgi:TRAP-type transport system periplasmic protein
MRTLSRLFAPRVAFQFAARASTRSCAVFTALLALLFIPEVSAKTNLDMSIWISHQAPFVQEVMLVWAKEVETVTAGRVSVRLLPKAVASPPQHFDAIRDGLADVTFSVHGYTPGRFVLTKMAEIPFLGDSAETISVAYNKIYFERFLSAREHDGVKLLSVFAHGPGHLFMTKGSPQSLADLRGLRIRSGGGIVNKTSQALGVNALMKPVTEQYEMLSSGVADGTLATLEGTASFKLTPLIKTGLLVPGGLFNTSFMLIMNDAKFKALETQDQEAILKISGEKFARLAGQVFDRLDAAGLGALRAAGAKLEALSPALLNEMKKAIEPVEAEWIKEAEVKGVDARAALTQFRANIADGKRQ